MTVLKCETDSVMESELVVLYCRYLAIHNKQTSGNLHFYKLDCVLTTMGP